MFTMIKFLSLIVILSMALISTGSAVALEIRVVDGKFVLTNNDGVPQPDAALIDKEIIVGTLNAGGYTARINDTVRHAPKGGTPLTLYDVSFFNPSNDTWEPLCNPGPYGLALAVPVPGRWASDGRYAPLPDGKFTFNCSSGAHVKCLRMGYAPWKRGPNGQSLAPYHQACTRMMRADYCGIGVPFTVAGKQILVHDRSKPKPQSSFGRFEAVWGEGGAICVHRARVPDRFPLGTILQACPKLKETAGLTCTETLLHEHPDALLSNRSR